jgi:hypothetical protein
VKISPHYLLLHTMPHYLEPCSLSLSLSLSLYVSKIMQMWLMVSRVWNNFGLQMDLDPPLEGGFKRLKKKIKLWVFFRF